MNLSHAMHVRVLVLVLVLVTASRARGDDDVRVHADTTLQAYDVQSPGSGVVWSRRRLIQTLGLTYVKALADSGARRPAPSLSFYLRLRLDQDFGRTCLNDQSLCFAIIDPQRRGSYTPIAAHGGIDLPAAYVELRDLPAGMQARFGRQLYADVVGLTRIDGVYARSAPRDWVAFESAFGALVRNTSIAAADTFNSGEQLRLDLDPALRDRAPYALPASIGWLAAASGELGQERWLRARLSARAVHEAGGFSAQRLGLHLASRPIEPLRFDAQAVFDALDPAVIDSQAGAMWSAQTWSAQLRLERHLPRFDPATIWAYFDVVPIWLATLAGQWLPLSGLAASLGIRGRRSDFADGAEHDLGLDGALALSDPSDSLVLAGFGWIADQGPLWGASVSASHRLSYVVTLEAEVSLFRVDDPLRAALRGFSLQELLGLQIAVSEESSIQLAATHSYGEAANHRLSLLFFLHLEAWR